MISIDALAPDFLTVTVALVGAPSAPDAYVDADHFTQTLELIRDAVPGIAAINTNENGAQTSVNGWLQWPRAPNTESERPVGG